MDLEGKGFGTRAVHGAGPPDPATGAVVPPISLATTFPQEAVGKHLGYEYSRSGNPTRTALETHLAALEGAAHGFAFASGLAAEDALLRLLAPGRPRAPARRRLRRHHPPRRPGARPGRPRASTPSTSPTSTRSRAAWTPGDPHGVGRDAEQPVAPHRRHRGDRRARPRARRHRRGRQHLRHPGAPAAARARRRRRRALHDQVPRRAQRRGRRLRRHRRRRARRAHRLPPERRRRGARPARLLPRAPRRPDPAAAHGAPQRERRWPSPSCWSTTRPSPRSSTRACPSHPGHDVAARQMSALRRDGLDPARRRRGGRARGVPPHRGVHARREPRRGREPHRAPRSHDARVGGRHAQRGPRRPRPPLRRHRGRRRPPRRPRPRPSGDPGPPLDLLRPGRSIVGMSAILLPHRSSIEVDWAAFEAHVTRTAEAGLTPGREHGHRVRAPAHAPSSAPRCSAARGRSASTSWPAPSTRPTSRRCRRSAARRCCSRPTATARRASPPTSGSPTAPTGSSASSCRRCSTPTAASGTSTPTGPCSASRSASAPSTRRSSASRSGTGCGCATRSGPTSWCSPATTSPSTW